MTVKYKFIKKKNPQQRDNPAKWYAVPKSNEPMDEENTTKTATKETTFSDVELGAASRLIARFVLSQLVMGNRVYLPGFGFFRLTFRSKGVEKIEDFDAASMIYEPRISFIADTKLRDELLSSLHFENAGVEEDGIYYGNLESYRNAKGSTSGGGEEELPLG